ncbi:MAG: hypothetical protein HYY29_04745 [Chloroflexi bacterium]|nr:hypothetical protein [Chloroflexota bacterium]MBI4332813.1 hypothetical protein [Chloroflexota bacterium]
MKVIVIDASVALKWYLPDEEDGDKALDILDGLASDSFALHAPALRSLFAKGRVLPMRC